MEQIIIDVQANTSKAEKALEGLSDQFENLSEAEMTIKRVLRL